MEIRPAQLADAKAIAEIHVSAWKVAYRSFVPAKYLDGLSAAEREADWEQVIASRQPQVRVAVIEDRLVGWISFGGCRDDDKPPETAEIWAIYVSPSQIGQGIGRELMRVALVESRRQGFFAATVWVLTENLRACRFYEKAGFVPEPDSVKTVEIGGATLEEIRYARVITG